MASCRKNISVTEFFEIKKKKKKKNEKIFMNVVCCSRDWRFKG